MSQNKLLKLPQFSRAVWILAGGRLLSAIGTGFTLFYAPIFFVNQVGISATLVGLALGSGSLSGVLGRFFGGQWADSPQWGRRKTLLLSAIISALADVVLVMTNNFPTLVIGNLLMGLGVGLYWPATEAAIIDLTTPEQRNESFAITRLADSLGLSLGVILGGALIANEVNYRLLFLFDGISFVIFFFIIYFAIAETYNFTNRHKSHNNGWLTALKDRRLTIFLVVNVLFTTYLSQIQSTLPLYFKNFISVGESQLGFSEKVISGLFSWHIVFAAIAQLPIARWLNSFSRIKALTISLVFWGVGFILIWLTGIVTAYPLVWAIVALGIMSLAMVSYTPSASAFIADIAPESLRGIYLSFNSQCWAVGYFIGPSLGGFALDNSINFVRVYWLACSGSIAIGILILQYLNTIISDTKSC
ncbi:Transporter, major facilitator superfamily [Hyella patelloides LEGE 07179]|uniref:Transporter, major facilitator superfamily n=1 Tax=Hyella patelloides LEGE 07179 TaxID=945734 RepID=A0A563VQC5_9CYAN|nr:MFS transporter [Hyella patelloides]VEP13666.1 Transporter, major facilitator superfamily [Hyella patelloides LEGE 07179]